MTLNIVAPVFDGDPACAEVGGDDWYPEPTGVGKGQAAFARTVCRGCEVRVQCLEWALATDEGWGIWGGLTEKERRALPRNRRAS